MKHVKKGVADDNGREMHQQMVNSLRLKTKRYKQIQIYKYEYTNQQIHSKPLIHRYSIFNTIYKQTSNLTRLNAKIENQLADLILWQIFSSAELG